MRKILTFIILLITLTLTACVNIGDNNYSFLFTEDELVIEIGSIDELPITLENMNTSDIDFVVAHPEIISLTGLFVSANQIGETTITATSKLLSKFTATITVKVTHIVPKFNITKDLFEIDEEIFIRLRDLDSSDFTWSVDNNEVGKLDESNKFTALAKGIVNVTVVSKTNSDIKNTYTINVIEKKPELYATTKFFKIGDKVAMQMNDFNNYTKNDYNWTISDPTILQISNDQVVTGLKNGTTTVTASLKNDPRVTSSYELTVGGPSTSVNGDGEPIEGPLVLTGFNPTATVQAGEALQFTLAGAQDLYNYKWSSNDTTIVQVNDEGVIYGVKAGQARVTIALKDNLSVRTELYVTVVGEPNVDYRSRIVDAALSQKGVKAKDSTKNNKFGEWYPFNNVDWCAIFVSWAANHAGVSTDIVTKFAYCPTGWEWFEENATTYLKGEYTPLPGDIIFFQGNGDGVLTHVGIVVEAHDGYILTIEGNTTSDSGAYGGGYVNTKQRTLSTSYIYGYAVPNYPEYSK